MVLSATLDFILDAINTNEKTSEGFGKNIRGRIDIRNSASVSDGKYVLRNELADVLSAKYLGMNLFEKLCSDVPPEMPPIAKEYQKKPPCFTRLLALLVRDYRNKLRNPMGFLLAMVAAILIAAILGSLYFLMPVSAVSSKTTGIAFATYISLFFANFSMKRLPLERRIWLRDHDIHLYNSLEYYVSIFLSELPKDVFGAILFSSVIYWMMGLTASASAFLVFIGVSIATFMAASAFGNVLGAVSPSATLVGTLFGACQLFIVMTNGV